MAGVFERCSDVACEGQLFFKQSRLAFAHYHQYWGVLRRESSSGGKRVELFGERSHASSRVNPQAVLHLTDVLHVTEREAKGHRFAFQVLATSCKHHLATKTAQERKAWLDALGAVLFGPPIPGIVYEYRVQVLPNSHSSQLQLVGHYVMKISDTELALYYANGSLPTKFRFELTHILRTRSTTFIKDRQKLCMLVIYTRRSLGGQYVFQSISAADISLTIDYRVKEMCRGENQLEDGKLPSETLNATDPIVLKSRSLPHKALASTAQPRPHSTAIREVVQRIDILNQSHSYPSEPHSGFTQDNDIIPLYHKASVDDDEGGVALPELDEDGYVRTRHAPLTSPPWKACRAMSAAPESHPRQGTPPAKQNQHQTSTGDDRHVGAAGSDGTGSRSETLDEPQGSDRGDRESTVPSSAPCIVPGVSVDQTGEAATFQLRYRKSTLVPSISNVHAVVEAPATSSSSSKPTIKPRKNLDRTKPPQPAPRPAPREPRDVRTRALINNATAKMSSHESHVTGKVTVLEESGVLFEERSAWLGAQQRAPGSAAGDQSERSSSLHSLHSLPSLLSLPSLPYYLTILPPDRVPEDYQSVTETVGPLDSPSLFSKTPSADSLRDNISSPLWGRSASDGDGERVLTPPGNSEGATHGSELLHPPSHAARVGRYSLQVDRDDPFFLPVVRGEVDVTVSDHTPNSSSDHTPNSSSDHTPNSSRDHTPSSSSDHTPNSSRDHTPSSSSDHTHSKVENSASADTSNSGTGQARPVSPSTAHPSLRDSGGRSKRVSSESYSPSSHVAQVSSHQHRSHSSVGEIGPFLRFDPLAKRGENIYAESLQKPAQSAVEDAPDATPPPSSPPLWSLRSRLSPVTILSLQRPDSESESEDSDSDDELELGSKEAGGCGLAAVDGYHFAEQVSVDGREEACSPPPLPGQRKLSSQSDHGYSTVTSPHLECDSNPYSSLLSDGYAVVKQPLEQTESNPYTSLGSQVAAPDPALVPPARTSVDSGGYSFINTPISNSYTNITELFTPGDRPPAPLPSGYEKENEETPVVAGPLSRRRGSSLRRVKSHSAEDVRRSVIYEDLDRCYCYSELSEIRAKRRVLLGSVGGAEECTYLTSHDHPPAVNGSTSPDRPRKLSLKRTAPVRVPPTPPATPPATEEKCAQGNPSNGSVAGHMTSVADHMTAYQFPITSQQLSANLSVHV